MKGVFELGRTETTGYYLFQKLENPPGTLV